MRTPIYIASCSFGKDSIATILLALENGEPLDRVVFAEVMFDHSRGISGELPEHIEWVYSTAIPKLESMGVTVDVVRPKNDYIRLFTRRIKHSVTPEKVGKLQGFLIGGMCGMNSEGKRRAIHSYYSAWSKTHRIVEYIGIAKDEPNRLGRIDGEKKVSLLDKYHYTEAMARAKAEEYGLLSPIYQSDSRNGCWFCPNRQIKQFGVFRKAHPDLWAELVSLSLTPNLWTYVFKDGKTVQEVEKIIDWNDRQLKLFEG